MNNSLIKVNSDVYSNIILKFGSTTKRPYKYSVKLAKGLKLSIKPNVVNNTVVININNIDIAVSTVQYDSLILAIGNVNKRHLIREWNMKDTLDVVFLKEFGSKAARANYQQDPTTMKKGKYRHRSKAFWMKCSDLPRGKYARDYRFKALTNLHVDAKINRSYSFKHHSMKFLAWKLYMSVNEVQSQLNNFRMSNSNTTYTFESWLNSRLVHILVLAGFYGSYTVANQAIHSGNVSINGVIIKNENTIVNLSDSITIASFDVVQQVHISGLVIDYNCGLIFIQAIPNLLNDALSHLYKEMFVGDIDSFMLNPINRWAQFTAPILVRGFNR